MELYHAVGEDLPENRTHFGGDAAFRTGKVMEPPVDIFGWTPEAAICERAAHFVNPGPSVPKRHLPPGGPATLFWQFKAWWAALEEHQKNVVCDRNRIHQQCPSWSTFWRAWSGKWSKFFVFRHCSQHKECNICFDLRESLKKKSLFKGEK